MAMLLNGLLRTGVFRVLYRFLRDGVKGRIREIIFTQEALFAICLGIAVGVFGPHYFPESAKLADISVGYIGYAAIALGFCVGSVTVALTLPPHFLETLATLQRPDKKGNALETLLFVFSWTAVVHWFSIFFIVMLLLLFGHRDESVLKSINWKPRAVSGLSVALCSYALMQFLITVLTLWQAGSAYIVAIRKKLADQSSGT